MTENFKKTAISIAILFLVGVGFWYVVSRAEPEQQAAIKPEKTDAAVAAVFEGYKQAAIEKNGKKAVEYVSQNTIDYYTEMLDLVKYGKREKVASRRLIDKLIILIIRHQYGEEAVRLFDGKELLEFAIDRGLVGSDIAQVSIPSFTFRGDEAFAKLQTAEGTAPQEMRFVIEGNQWKMDVVSVIPLTNTILTAYLREEKVAEDEFLFLLLESTSGVKTTEKIWEPLVK